MIFNEVQQILTASKMSDDADLSMKKWQKVLFQFQNLLKSLSNNIFKDRCIFQRDLVQKFIFK